MLGSEDIKPGVLLHTAWDWFGFGNRPEKFIKEEGYPWTLLNMKDENDFHKTYPHKLNNASIIAGKITDKVQFGANLALPQYGFSAETSFAEERAVKLTIGGVKVDSFDVGFAEYDLREKLRELERTDRKRWAWVNDDFLVTDSYYTSELRFEFKNQGDFNAKATYDKLNFSGGFNASWTNDTTLVLKGTAKVPFAVRGIKV
jgi:hypothetical protein